MQTKMVGVIKASLKVHDAKAYEMFNTAMEKAGGCTTRKRFYSSCFGYSNVKDLLLGKTDTLIKADNFDRFELENITEWWKKKAGKRYEKLIAEKRKRDDLEVWNQDTMNKIDIIR